MLELKTLGRRDEELYGLRDKEAKRAVEPVL
jgi:hypothetical protein